MWKPKTYRPIPDKGIKLYLEAWGCGELCDCKAVQIRVMRPSQSGIGSTLIWESNWFFGYTTEELDEIRAEVMAACAHYGIEEPDLYGNSIFDWKGEQAL